MIHRLLLCLTALLSAIAVWAGSDLGHGDEVEEQIQYQLSPIVVTATRTPQPLWESEASVTLVTDDEIQQSTAQHLGDVLRLLPGITMGSFGGIGQNISVGMRGSTAGQVLFLVDGVPINDPQHGGLDLNQISLDNVERIEVLRGSASSLYGADALGGVIHVVTKSTVYETPFSRLTYMQGDDSLEKIAGQFARLVGKRLGLQMVASSTETDGFRTNSDYLGRHLSARLDYAFADGWKATYSTQMYRSELGVPGMDMLPTPKARQKDRSWNHTIALQGSLTPEHSLNIKLYRIGSRQEYEDPDWFTQADHRRWIHGVEVQTTLSVTHTHRVTAGGELQHRRLDSSENGRHRTEPIAFFAQDEVRFHPKIRMRLSGRYDHQPSFEDQFCPHASLIWLACDEASLSASLGTSYRAPTFNDLHWPCSEYDYDLDGQPDYGESGNIHIKPEKAVSFQVGTRARLGWISGDVAFFGRKVRDLIQWDNVDDSYRYGYWMPQNRSQATIRGYECQATARPWNHLHASMAYTYLEAEDDLLGKLLPYQPRHSLSSHIQCGVPLMSPQLKVIARLGVEYLGVRYADAWEVEKLPGSVVLRAKLTVQALALTVFVAGENLGNEQYVLRHGYPLPGRTLWGGICWDFWD